MWIYTPPPKFDKIIEPFAGSARYALKYFEKDVLLVDKYPIIVDLWNWLKQCSINDILTLPDIETGQTLNDFDLCKEAKWLIGFFINAGSASPKLKAKDFNKWNENRKTIADNLFKIKHWEIKLGSYENCPDIEATWFIDPPYQFGGEWYAKSNKHIDFGRLGTWCREKQGQVIVCENSKANWMDFKQMKQMQGTLYKTTEVIWCNLPTAFDYQQQSLF